MCKLKKPAWWQVYAIVIGALILLWWEGHAGLAGLLEQIVLVGIVLLTYGLIALWVQANQAGLEREDLERTRTHQARARQEWRKQTQEQADRSGPSQGPAPGRGPTLVQAHFRQIMREGKLPRR